MQDFDVQRFSRRCAKTDRDLQPGEEFYSVLVPDGAQIARIDYAAAAWEGAPENAIGWWKARVPDEQGNRVQWAPNEVLLNYFHGLAEQPDKSDTRYMLALLLVRRRIMRQEPTETDELGREMQVLFCPLDGQEYRVPVVMPAAKRLREIQDEFASLLNTGGS